MTPFVNSVRAASSTAFCASAAEGRRVFMNPSLLSEPAGRARGRVRDLGVRDDTMKIL
jgi:hypothetical protein